MPWEEVDRLRGHDQYNTTDVVWILVLDIGLLGPFHSALENVFWDETFLIAVHGPSPGTAGPSMQSSSRSLLAVTDGAR